MRTINQVLDQAKAAQKVKSDYKLSLCIGIGESSLSSYRLGKTLPDEKACMKLADAMGEDSGFLVLEMQAQRAKDPTVRSLWESLAKRLQKGFAAVQMMVLVAIFSIAASAIPYLLALYSASFSATQSVYYVKSLLERRRARRGLIVKIG